ncbi:MAG: FG-GAP-like repeat-containing protein [Flavobacterium sp. JAD_PAG50586_2]|nr:MAG: FG-GAP-like repeat-containing protein [Flavobacterium sp. JAD_PAG50586_2]
MKKYIVITLLLVFSAVKSQNYQDTQGKLEVSGSGSATYTLPIAMPPSIQNVGPIINLVYGSGQMGGVAGQGWNINSISAISRIATRKDLDGYIDGVDFDSNDMLALDGQRLLLKTGTYWANGATYQTETQSNTRIEQVGTGVNMYFIVTAADGSRSWYGNYGGMNAVDNTAYYITRFEDTNGNYMTYNYIKPFNKGFCIKWINFSANSISGITAQNSIYFTYKTIARTENSYVKGIKQEKEELLDKIQVYAGDLLFRKYQLYHATDAQLGYQKVIKIQESNGAGELANPVEFEYNQTISSSGPETEIVKTYNNNIDFEDVTKSGDFDGDGRLDFATSTQMFVKNFEGNTGNAPITLPQNSPKWSITTLNNNKLLQQQSLLYYTKLSNTQSRYKAYNYENGVFNVLFEKTIDLNLNITKQNLQTSSGGVASIECLNYYSPTNYYVPDNKAEGLEGDFDGNGISEILISIGPDQYKGTVQPFYPPQPYTFNANNCPIIVEPVNGPKYYVLDLDPNASTVAGSSGYRQISGTALEWYSPFTSKVGDFNGDGKSDVLTLYQASPSSTVTSYKIFEIIKSGNYSYPSIIGQGTIDTYSRTKQMLFGDYNGDGKTDFMLPNTEGGEGAAHTLWHIYFSNPNPAGGSFFVKESQTIVEYRPNSGNDYQTQVIFNSYYALDVNKDGKSDMVKINLEKYGTTSNGNNTLWRIYTYANNLGNNAYAVGNQFTADYTSPYSHFSGSPEIPTPIVSSYRYNGLNQEILIIRNHYKDITYINFKKDVSKDILLKKVISSGGSIIDQIEYAPLEPSVTPNGLGILSDFYSSGDAVVYPNVEIKRLPASQVVQKLTNSCMDVTKYQDFKYHGFVVNMDGMGAIGFRKTAKSAWYINPSSKRIWSVFENDPLLRGTMVRSYTQMCATGSNFSFVSSGNPIGIINSNTNTYVSNTTNGLFTIYLNTHIIEDFLTTVKNEYTYTYLSPYILEETVITKNYLGSILQGTSTSTKEYDNNPLGTGSAYYVGRPTRTLSSVTAYGDTFGTEEKYSYTGSRLTKKESKANNTDGVYLTEEYEYFANGNLKKKTLSAPGAIPAVSARVTEFTYDPTERFIKTATDVEGLVSTNNTYHSLYGVVLSASNPYGIITSSVYDNWGKRTKVTDYLGKNTNYTYTKSSGVYTTLQTGDDGSSSTAESDALGRTIRTGVKNINGNWSYTSTEYDFMNRKTRESQPYFAGFSPSLWTTYAYDEYSRTTQTVAHTGLTATATYNGLTVTTNDGTKTTTATINANGHTVTTSDDGGVITNTYFANGNLKTATYGSTILSIEYDGWGRKTKLTDPTAGVYRYEYNAYGETIKEITPKGATTYNLLPTGKVNFSTIIGTGGDTTNTKNTYTYDSTSKLLTAIRFDDFTGGFYTTNSYGYDSYKRLNLKDEVGPQASYQQAIQFDAFGRPEKELYTAICNGKQSSKWVRNTYKNGYPWQILDDASSQVLWQTNNVNARGQIETAGLGNGIAITNSYDTYGYSTQMKHDRTGSSTTNVMTLNTVFHTTRGNLTSRYNSLFNWAETFQYDDLDRLTGYPNALGETVQQTYELDGRIKQNSLGTYNYAFLTKKYQNTSVLNTTESFPYYLNRRGIFRDDMESKTGWLIYEPAVVTYDTTIAKTGATSIKIDNTTNGEKTVQSALWIKIDNTADTQYTYGGWVKGTGSQAELFLYMKTATETGPYTQVDQIISATGEEWVYFEKTVLVPANIKKLNLRLDNNATGTVWFDDVWIRKTSDGTTSSKQLNIKYNVFKSPVTIEEGNIDMISFEYNYANNRSTMYYGGLQTNKTQRQYRKYYSDDGSMEVKRNMFTGDVEFITYLGGDGYSAPVVLKSDGTTQEYLYLHRDYQGSIVAITNQAAVVIEKRLFDAWGKY